MLKVAGLFPAAFWTRKL